MRIIHHVSPACDCRARIELFAKDQARVGTTFDIGSIIECDCGQEYKLVDEQRDGRYWKWHNPNSSDPAER